MASLPYVLGHGLENTFAVLGAGDADAPPTPASATKTCRDLGVDGLLVLEEGEGGRPFMRIFNADGSEPEMCGNGLRVFARYLVERCAALPGRVEIETPAGTRRARVENGLPWEPWQVEVEMGRAVFCRQAVGLEGDGPCDDLSLELNAGGEALTVSGAALSVGNPHLVLFGGAGYANPERVTAFAKAVEHLGIFSDGVNLSLAEPAGPSGIKLVVYERGCGLTRACGTAACAAAAAAARRGTLPYEHEVTVHLPGGDLSVWVRESDSSLKMKGPAMITDSFPEPLDP